MSGRTAPEKRVDAMAMRITLPWDVLCSVNQRTVPAGRRQVLSPRYRARLVLASLHASQQARRQPRIAPPVAMTVRFHEPDNRQRDPGNFMKLIEDALIGSVYYDDTAIGASRWERAGVDRANPRVEIEVVPLHEVRAA